MSAANEPSDAIQRSGKIVVILVTSLLVPNCDLDGKKIAYTVDMKTGGCVVVIFCENN
jgi:hypothetical protein